MRNFNQIYKNEDFLFVFIFIINAIFLLYAISNLSISYYEAKIFYNDTNLVNFIINLSCKIFGQNDYALRLPFLMISLANSILLYKLSKRLLKRKIDRLFCVVLYMFLPGVMTSAILVNMAGISIFFTLLFLYLFELKKTNFAIFILIISVFIDKSFNILYLGVFFYGLYKNEKKLFIPSFLLFILTFIFYDFNISGKPKSYFLDTIGVYAAVFSPLLFLFFIYCVYRIWVKEEKNILWFIVITSFCTSLILSLRQKVELEEFLPYCVIGVPLIIRVFFNSYRVRLPKFRKKYNILAFFLGFSLALSSLFLVFNQFQYFLFFKNNPQKHFIYKYDIAKELAKELKKLDLTKIVVFDDELALRLKFYGIEIGSSLILSSEAITNPKHIIKIKSMGVLKAEFYIF